MQEIKAVIFDAGGVMLEGNIEQFLEKCEKGLGLRPTKNITEHGGAIFGREMALGFKHPKKSLNELFGGNLSKEKADRIVEIYLANWIENQKMVELAKKLKKKYKVALLSNTDNAHTDSWEKNGFAKLFDVVIASNKVHLVKPGERIYKLVLERLGLKAGQCVFVDDMQACTEAAERLGFRTILFKNPEQCKKELEKFRVVV